MVYKLKLYAGRTLYWGSSNGDVSPERHEGKELEKIE